MGIDPLTDKHWQVIRFMRNRYLETGTAPNIPPVPVFITLLSDSGAKLYACKASVEMLASRARTSSRNSKTSEMLERVARSCPAHNTLELESEVEVRIETPVAGVCGVVSFAVSQRTREMGIRIAVGASSGQVMRMVVREGLQLVAIGGGIGLLLATAVSGPLSSALYGVPRLDVSVFALVSLLFATVAALASFIPGRRAARVEPVVALKHE